MIYDDGMGFREQLPKLTLGLEERYEAARAETDRRASAKAKLALMVEALGEAYVEERCGSAEVEDVDLSELQALFIDVSIAYGLNGVREVEAALAGLMPVVEKVERLNALTGKTAGRQGFSRVL